MVDLLLVGVMLVGVLLVGVLPLLGVLPGVSRDLGFAFTCTKLC